jgi:hypothetical protein
MRFIRKSYEFPSALYVEPAESLLPVEALPRNLSIFPKRQPGLGSLYVIFKEKCLSNMIPGSFRETIKRGGNNILLTLFGLHAERIERKFRT